MPYNTACLTLKTLLATYPNTVGIKDQNLNSPLFQFDFADVEPANKAFKRVVRNHEFDVAELAIVTYLQAFGFNTPYVLMPIVVVARGQHHTIVYNPERGHLEPEDLKGRRVGVRAYTQTTGAWVRGILQEDYGVNVQDMRCIIFEDPHVAEYRDPEWVERAPAGKDLAQMLVAGELDAAIVGNKIPDPHLKHLIPHPERLAADWAPKHGGVPINHMLVVKKSIIESRPDIVQELYRQFVENANSESAPAQEAIRFGVDAVRGSLETIIQYSMQQELIPRKFEVDELFVDATRALNR